MRSKRILPLCLAALFLAMALPLVAEPNVAAGEFRVNQTNTLIRQINPTAAFDGAGNALVVWEHEVAGVKGRFFGADGVAVGPELTLVANSAVSVPFQGTVASRRDPVAAFLPNGSFFVFWTEQFSYQSVALFIQSVQIQESDVYGQLFDHSGKSVGAAFRVNTTTAGAQSLPKVAARANDLVVVWQSDHRSAGVIDQAIYGQRVDFSGHRVGGEFRATPASIQAVGPALAAGPAGKFIVAWEANDAQGKGIFAQLFDASAAPSGSDFRVNTDTALDQRRPAVAADRSGNFFVAWQSQYQTVKQARIFGQLVGPAGNLVGGQLAISNGHDLNEVAPAVAAGKNNGDFLAVWLNFDSTFPRGIYASQVTGNGAGTPVQINHQSLNYNTRSALATDGHGKFLASWQGFISRQAAITAELISE